MHSQQDASQISQQWFAKLDAETLQARFNQQCPEDRDGTDHSSQSSDTAPLTDNERAEYEKVVLKLRSDIRENTATDMDVSFGAARVLHGKYENKAHECRQLKGQLTTVMDNYEALQQRFEWLQQQLATAMRDSQQLQSMFLLNDAAKSATPAKSSLASSALNEGAEGAPRPMLNR